MKNVTLRHIEKIKPWLVTAERGEDGVLLHPDSRRCLTKKEAEKVAKEWTMRKGIRFIVQ